VRESSPILAGRALRRAEDPVAVDQRNGQAVDLRLADKAKRGSSMPSAREMAAHPGDPGRSSASERTFASDSIG